MGGAWINLNTGNSGRRGCCRCLGLSSLALFMLLLAGCATTNGGGDPLEPFNRAMHTFNDNVDKVAIKPLAQGYQAVMPPPIDRGVTNFFSNLNDVVVAVNDLLQLKFKYAVTDLGRILINSTIGVLGIFDVATKLDLAKNNEDFGQTMGAWGAGQGPYIVLPILGPSTLRDTVGLIPDIFLDPVRQVSGAAPRNSLVALRAVDKRADLLQSSRLVERAALDPYEFVRDAYLQRRRYLIHDGNPPMDMDLDNIGPTGERQ